MKLAPQPPKPMHELYEKLANLYYRKGDYDMYDQMMKVAREQKRLTWN